MASGLQLTIDGREELAEHAASSQGPFTAAQIEILRLLADRQTIRSIDAGRIVHAHREPPCARCERGCCGFTSVDGSAALKRLQERGLVRRVAAGLWSSQAELDPEPARGADIRRGIRGPKGARVGDVVIVERSRWRVLTIDPERRDALCQLIGGSQVLRHFRARNIAKVERGS